MSTSNLFERFRKVQLQLFIVELFLLVSFSASQTSLSSQDSSQEIDQFLHTNSYHIVEPATSDPFDQRPQQAGHQNNNQHFDTDLGNSFNIANKNNLNDADYYYPESTSNNSNHLSRANTDSQTVPNSNNQHSIAEKEYLDQELSMAACGLDRGCQRKDRLNNTYLTYCTRYKLENLLSNEILMSIMHDSSGECERILDEFMQLDQLINQFDGFFRTLLMRYNCHNGYSVKWNCDDCKKAYKDWLCATNLPYYMKGERIKPCISFCERVEQRCPYFHPITKEQYGGQPVFICRDPNIPFVPEITPDIPYSEPTKCYDLCHLSDNITELISDSLSKYDYNKCPDKGSIAEEVRSDPSYCKLDTSLQSNVSKTSMDDQYDPNFPDDGSPININGTLSSDVNIRPGDHRLPHVINVHTKKLTELREVLAAYKSQPKTHKFGHHSDHSSSDTSNEKQNDMHSS